MRTTVEDLVKVSTLECNAKGKAYVKAPPIAINGVDYNDLRCYLTLENGEWFASHWSVTRVDFWLEATDSARSLWLRAAERVVTEQMTERMQLKAEVKNRQNDLRYAQADLEDAQVRVGKACDAWIDAVMALERHENAENE